MIDIILKKRLAIISVSFPTISLPTIVKMWKFLAMV